MALTNAERSKAFRARIKNGYTPRPQKKKGTYVSKRDARLLKNYGISSAQYQYMYDDQQGCCYICNEYKEQLVVDHDHNTGRIRKLLCSNCNIGIGNLRDNPNILRKAASYIIDMFIDNSTLEILNS